MRVYNVSQVEYLPVTVTQLKRATAQDPQLSKVLQFTKFGWPSRLSQNQLSAVLKPYWTRRSELTTESGCLLRGTRVIIPPKLHQVIQEELHIGHPGIVCMKAIARSYVWWPGVYKDIENKAKTCKQCQSVKQAPPKAPLHPWVWPTRPWERIHIDFAGPCLNTMFMIVTDAHSKLPEIIQMKETTAPKTIQELLKLFATYGLPLHVVTDNGPQFTSTDFATFLKSNWIKHIKCSPYHPSSNGAAERQVQTFKRSLKASVQKGRPLQQALCKFLLSYRNTPHATTNESPSMLFMKRPLRTRLDLLRPNTQAMVEDKQAQQKKDHDVHTKQRYFQIGSSVLAKNFTSSPTWLSGTVLACLSPLTYSIQLDDGRIWKRHIDHMLKDGENRKHDEVAPTADDWVYGMPFEDEPMVPVAEDRVVTNTELPSRYPTRN